MKRILFLIVASIAIVSCSEDENNNSVNSELPKLKKTIKVYPNNLISTTEYFYSGGNLSEVVTHMSNSDNNYKYEYIYDEGVVTIEKKYINNQYISGSDRTFNYDNDKLSYTLVNEDGILTKNEYTYDNSGRLSIKKQYDNGNLSETSNYVLYENGNVNKVIKDEGEYILTYTYDDNKNPVFYSYSGVYFPEISKNNTLTRVSNDGFDNLSYTYEYNESGLPIKCTEVSNTSTSVTTYEYY